MAAYSSVQSITPLGNAYTIVTNNTTANTVVVGGNGASVNNLFIENLDTTNDVFINWAFNGKSVTAVVPTVGSPQTGVTVQNGSGRIIQINTGTQFIANANVAAISFSGTPQIVITNVA